MSFNLFEFLLSCLLNITLQIDIKNYFDGLSIDNCIKSFFNTELKTGSFPTCKGLVTQSLDRSTLAPIFWIIFFLALCRFLYPMAMNHRKVQWQVRAVFFFLWGEKDNGQFITIIKARIWQKSLGNSAYTNRKSRNWILLKLLLSASTLQKSTLLPKKQGCNKWKGALSQVSCLGSWFHYSHGHTVGFLPSPFSGGSGRQWSSLPSPTGSDTWFPTDIPGTPALATSTACDNGPRMGSWDINVRALRFWEEGGPPITTFHACTAQG